jgi:nucleotide-binding universal stress UspA family protein
MIVMGTHGYGMLGRAILGSVAQGVLAHAGMPVLLVQ